MLSVSSMALALSSLGVMPYLRFVVCGLPKFAPVNA